MKKDNNNNNINAYLECDGCKTVKYLTKKVRQKVKVGFYNRIYVSSTYKYVLKTKNGV